MTCSKSPGGHLIVRGGTNISIVVCFFLSLSLFIFSSWMCILRNVNERKNPLPLPEVVVTIGRRMC